jgi:hypothetical protein
VCLSGWKKKAGLTDLRDEDFQTALDKRRKRTKQMRNEGSAETSRIATTMVVVSGGKRKSCIYMFLCSRKKKVGKELGERITVFFPKTTTTVQSKERNSDHDMQTNRV